MLADASPAGVLPGRAARRLLGGSAQRAIGGTLEAGGRCASGVLIGHDTAFPRLWLRQAVDLVQCRHTKAVDYAAQTVQVDGSVEPAIWLIVLMRARRLMLMGARLSPILVSFNGGVTQMLRRRWHGKSDHRRRCEQQRQEQT